MPLLVRNKVRSREISAVRGYSLPRCCFLARATSRLIRVRVVSVFRQWNCMVPSLVSFRSVFSADKSFHKMIVCACPLPTDADDLD